MIILHGRSENPEKSESIGNPPYVSGDQYDQRQAEYDEDGHADSGAERDSCVSQRH